MNTMLTTYLVLSALVIIIGVFLMAKNYNACKNRCKIIDAICSYKLHLFSLGIFDHTDLYSKMESYDSTMYRLWDWGYTRILPPKYFQLVEPFIERRLPMLEKLLKELGEKGYEVSWRYNVTLDCIDIRLERRFNKQWYKLNRMVTFAEMRDISGGQPGFEFAMTQCLRWMVNKMEEDMGKHYGYRPQVVICDELAGKKGENDE